MVALHGNWNFCFTRRQEPRGRTRPKARAPLSSKAALFDGPRVDAYGAWLAWRRSARPRGIDARQGRNLRGPRDAMDLVWDIGEVNATDEVLGLP